MTITAAHSVLLEPGSEQPSAAVGSCQIYYWPIGSAPICVNAKPHRRLPSTPTFTFTSTLHLRFTQLHLKMAARIPLKLSRNAVLPSSFFSQRFPSSFPARTLATVTPSLPSSSGPNGTAIVLLNMGGPSTVPEVHDFLSRLFVCIPLASLNFVLVRS